MKIIEQNVLSNIREWLLNSSIQILEGEEEGGVCGWLNENHEQEYVYFEITGYYLTFLAFLAKIEGRSRDALLIENKAAKAIKWIGKMISNNEFPETRRYVIVLDNVDWRNRAVFSFDMAMAIKGISDILPFLCDPITFAAAQTTLSRLTALFEKHFIRDRRISSHLMREGNHQEELPKKWSTYEYIHHAKTASALLSISDTYFTPTMKSACENELNHWRSYFYRHDELEDLHPFYYYLEGFILSDVRANHWQDIFNVESIYSEVMRQQSLNGGLPASLAEDCDEQRSDVIAQALRVGSILKSKGLIQGEQWDVKLDKLAASLEKYFLDGQGAVTFFEKNSSKPLFYNAWATMFTFQALYFYELATEGKALDDSILRYII